jgi:hypothetical protein
LFSSLAQRRGFREYLAGLLAPRDRNKTLTALAGAEPVAGAQDPAVQRLQFFLSESRWDPERVNARRLELLRADPATAPHDGGVLVIDDSGDRKDGTKTAHVGRQWLGRYGKTGNGVVTVTTLWADERLYYPVHAVPYTPAGHFAKGKNDPAFRTRLAIGAELAARARAAGFAFRAVVADNAYGDKDGFRAGHAESWWAAEATLGSWGPDGARRLAAVSADPATLPEKATWYLVTNLPRPGGPREAESPWPAAPLAEITRIYGLRNWIGQGYKQVRDELGWADFQVRSDIAIRRHQVLVNCAFSFCQDAWFADPPPDTAPRPGPGRGERGAARRAAGTVLAAGAARRARLAFPLDRAAALVAGLVQGAPAAAAASPDRLGRGRLRPAPLHP